jgi:hypothetical protein
MKQKEIYVAGPMSGYADFNFPAFFAAAEKLAARGWKVWNPADKESENGVQESSSYATGDNTALVASGWDYRNAFHWDCEKVIYGDGIYMLRGWEYSPGACAEHAVAKFIKKQNPDYEIIYE